MEKLRTRCTLSSKQKKSSGTNEKHTIWRFLQNFLAFSNTQSATSWLYFSMAAFMSGENKYPEINHPNTTALIHQKWKRGICNTNSPHHFLLLHLPSDFGEHGFREENKYYDAVWAASDSVGFDVRNDGGSVAFSHCRASTPVSLLVLAMAVCFDSGATLFFQHRRVWDSSLPSFLYVESLGGTTTLLITFSHREILGITSSSSWQ